MSCILKVEKLFSGYKELIIKDISFEVNAGEVICLIGANGSGKSTLLSSLVNMNFQNFVCSKNSVWVNDKSISLMNRNEIAKNISYMIQNESCVWNFSVYDFICLGNYFSKNISENKIDEILSTLNIFELKNKNVNQLSGGEFQKVRIARTIFQNTPVLLFDEPISNLDINYQYSLLKSIRKIVKEKKSCAIISIHDINLASIFADKIFLLKKINECSENESQLLIGNSEEILTSKTLSTCFNTKLETFLHPDYKKIQVYVKGNLNDETK